MWGWKHCKILNNSIFIAFLIIANSLATWQPPVFFILCLNQNFLPASHFTIKLNLLAIYELGALNEWRHDQDILIFVMELWTEPSLSNYSFSLFSFTSMGCLIFIIVAINSVKLSKIMHWKHLHGIRGNRDTVLKRK